MPAPITTSTPTVRKHATALPHIFNIACPSPGKIHAAMPIRAATAPDLGSGSPLAEGCAGGWPDQSACAVDLTSPVIAHPLDATSCSGYERRSLRFLGQKRQDLVLHRASH